MSVPSEQITSASETDLVENFKKPRWKWRGPLDRTHDYITTGKFYADANRLMVDSGWGSLVVLTYVAVFAFVLFVLAVLMVGLASLADDHFSFSENKLFIYGAVACLVITILSIYLLIKYNNLHYYVFDRKHQTVYLPKTLFRRACVLPFEDIECYDARVYAIGLVANMSSYNAFIVPTRVPRDIGGIRQRISLGGNSAETDQQWKFICRYMNTTLSLPSIGCPAGDMIDFLGKHRLPLMT